jgi:hypothetical protein
MLRRIGWTALLSALTATAAPQGCVGSFAVANFRLTVAPPSGNAAPYVGIRQVSNIPAGYRIRYQPQELPDLEKDARLTLVLVPKTPDGQLTILEPRPIAAATEWTAPFAARIALLVFAPQGLDEKRLSNLVTRDQNLVMALADYADQTADLEAGLETIRALEDDADDDKPYRPTTPAEQALFAVLRALNPAASPYNPLGAGRRTRAASLMGQGADAFFENAGGMVPGGGVLPALKPLLMPDTEFRAVFARTLDSGMMALCAQVQARTRNKIAYLWAYRVIGSGAPVATVGSPSDLALGTRVVVPLRLDKSADPRALDRATDWTLLGEGNAPPLPVSGRAYGEERSIHLDLRNFTGPPGAYRIEARWDWETLSIRGNIRLHRLDSFESAQITPDSQNQLIAGTGPVFIELAGADFVFVDKAALHRPGSTYSMPAGLPTDRSNPSWLRVEIDTGPLRPGPYLLALTRVDGASFDVPVQVLPAPPKITGEPLRVNSGEKEQTITISGTGLDRIQSFTSEAADVILKPPATGTRREAAIRLHSGVKPGDQVAVAAKVDGMPALLRFPGLLQVVGPRPLIREAKASLPRDLPIAPREGELPAGSWVSFALRVEPANIQPVLTLQCDDPARAVQTITLRPGEKQALAQWTGTGDGAWFLSLDPGALGQSGCALEAVIETESLGKSDRFGLGKVMRLPRIESLSLTDEKLPEGFAATLLGFDLETVEKTGWSAQSGVPIPELPRPVAGEGARQALRIVMPWPSPSPKAPLFVWLRGESEGRATRITP